MRRRGRVLEEGAFGDDFVPVVAGEEGAVDAVEVDAEAAGGVAATEVEGEAGGAVHHPGEGEVGVAPGDFLGVGGVAVVLDGVAAAGAGGDFGDAEIEGPDGEVDDVGRHAGRPAAGVIPERAVVIAVGVEERIEGAGGSGAEPSVPIEALGRILFGGAADAVGALVHEVESAGDADFAEFAGADPFDDAAVVGGGMDLGADLADALMAVDGVADGERFGGVEGHRFLQVDILAGLNGVDGHEGMPVGRRGDDDAVDVAAGEEFAIVDVAAGGGRVEGEGFSRRLVETSQMAVTTTSGCRAQLARLALPMPLTPMMPRLMRSLGAGRPARPRAEAGTMAGRAAAWRRRRRLGEGGSLEGRMDAFPAAGSRRRLSESLLSVLWRPADGGFCARPGWPRRRMEWRWRTTGGGRRR